MMMPGSMVSENGWLLATSPSKESTAWRTRAPPVLPPGMRPAVSAGPAMRPVEGSKAAAFGSVPPVRRHVVEPMTPDARGATSMGVATFIL